MGLFSKKKSSIPSTPSPSVSPKFGSQSSRSTSSSPKTPSFPSKPAAQLAPPPDPKTDPEGYLTSLQAVRQRSRLVFDKVQKGQGVCFTLDPAKIDDVISYVVGIIKVWPVCRIVDSRETMILRIRVSHLMDVGSISMSVEDNVLNSSFSHGGPSTRGNELVDCWTCFLCLCFLMLEREIFGNLPQSRGKGMDEARDSLLEVWICLKRGCLAVTSRILTGWIV